MARRSTEYLTYQFNGALCCARNGCMFDAAGPGRELGVVPAVRHGAERAARMTGDGVE